MSTKVNQRETLFNFVSIRPPQLADIKNPNLFVQHPTKEGLYFDAVKNSGDKGKWEAMQVASSKITALRSDDINRQFARHIPAARWIAQNSTAQYKEILTRTEGLDTLKPEEITKLWDNLFYQIVIREDVYAKEAAIQLIVLQNLLQQKQTLKPEEFVENLPKLAKARTMLPTELFAIEKEEEVAGGSDAPLFSTKELIRSQESSFARYAIGRNEKAIAELKELQKIYRDNYDKHYLEALKDYEVRVAKAYESASYEDKEVIDCATGCPHTVRQYTDLKHEEFNFAPPVEIDEKALQKALSEASFYIIKSLNLLGKDTYDAVISGVEQSMSGHTKVIFSNLPSPKIVSVGKMKFVNDSSEKNINPALSESQYPFIATTRESSGTGAKKEIFITLDTGKQGAEVSSAHYTVSTEKGDFSSDALESSPEGNLLNLILFKAENGVDIPLSGPSMLRVNLTLADGTTLHIDSALHPEARLSGVAYSDKEHGAGARAHARVAPGAAEPLTFGIKRLGIADYRKVVSEVCCYRESEVSHVENIMDKEFRSKTTTRERVEETTLTTENIIEKESLTDTSSTERLEMQSEVARLLDQQKQFGAHATISGEYAKVRFETGANYATSTAKSESNRQAVIESKEITEHASERISTRFREEMVHKITERFKEENSHIFDNRQGTGHVSGVYRYINAIYKNQIYNYGKRLIYEFMVPDPSRLHRLGMEIPADQRTGGTNSPELQMPYAPSVYGLTNSTLLNEWNYREFASMYSARVTAPELANIVVGQAFSGKGGGGSFAQDHNELKIPDGYKVQYISHTFTMVKANNGLYARVQYGDKPARTVMATPSGYGYITSDYSGYVDVSDYNRDVLPISVSGWDIGAYTLNVTAFLERTQDSFHNWQIKTYEDIVAAYKARLEEYYASQSIEEVPQETTFGTNPLFYREIEKNTLKRNCISYLLGNNYTALGTTDFISGSFTNYNVSRSQQMDDFSKLVRFMEEAFEWNIMSYNFYPYYWAGSNKWLTLYQTEYDDPTFREFMQSGMARVLLTVRPGYEDAVMYFMVTKQLWEGGSNATLADPLYASIVADLAEQEYVVEDTWETVVPTSLIGLQKEGVLIDIDGLPCGDGCEDATTENPLKVNTNKLGLLS